MDENTTPQQALDEVRAQLVQTARQHIGSYRRAAELQDEQVHQLLAQTPPDYSGAATACHRALQFTRQAQALEQLAKDTGLW